MKWLKKKIFRFLKIKYWGVGFELELPPEFIISTHADMRLRQRLVESKVDMPKLVIESWYDGENPPESFQPNMANIDPKMRKRFPKFKYKYYGNYIFIFGVRYSRFFHDGQKTLITIYNWK